MKLASSLLFAVAASAPTLLHATVYTFDLQGTAGFGLLAGNETSTVNGSPGSGGELGSGITFDDSSNLLTISIGWGSGNGFTDLTGAAIGAHIHGPTTSGGTASFSQAAGVLVDLSSFPFSFSSSASSGFVSGSTTLSPTNATALFDGRLYINIHTSLNSGGEIRGNLVNPQAIPEPSTYAALTGLGALVLAIVRRRAKG